MSCAREFCERDPPSPAGLTLGSRPAETLKTILLLTAACHLCTPTPPKTPKIMATRKTILHIEVTGKEYSIQYSGSLIEAPTSKENFKHDERILRMLVSDRKVFDFFFRLVEPARRFYLREEKKKRKAENGTTSVVNQ